LRRSGGIRSNHLFSLEHSAKNIMTNQSSSKRKKRLKFFILFLLLVTAIIFSIIGFNIISVLFMFAAFWILLLILDMTKTEK